LLNTYFYFLHLFSFRPIQNTHPPPKDIVSFVLSPILYLHSKLLSVMNEPHRNMVDFECKLCKKSFNSAEDLNLHKSSHNKYTCELCHAKFRSNTDLIRHSRQHTGEKPHKCEICNISYSRKSTLTRHKNFVHLKDTTHQCEMCRKIFARRCSLLKHIEQTHC